MAGGKKQKTNRKYGRERKRHLSSIAYTQSRRWETNKKKRIARHNRRMLKKAEKLAKRAMA